MILTYTTYALKNEICPLPIEDEKAFFQQAKESGLLALVFEAMDQTIVSKTLYSQMERLYFSFIQKDLSQHALKDKINTLFNTHQIDHLFLKGAQLKKMYPKSYLRGMGDIDCLVREKDILKTQKLLKQAGFQLESKSDVHDVYDYHHQMVEIHQKIYKEKNRKDRFILRYPWDYVTHEGDHLYRLTPEFECLHLLSHLSKHILSSGVGFRSLLDIQIYLNHEPLNKTLLYTYLKDAKLYDFFHVIIAFNKKAFGLNTPFNTNDISEETYETIKTYLLKSGIHGKGTDFNPMAPRVVKNNKIKVILKVMFPSYSDMKNKYKAVRYVPLLLPFFYPVRWFRLIFLQSKQSRQQLKRLAESNEAVDDMAQTINTFKLGE